jgi:hypothetical protein
VSVDARRVFAAIARLELQVQGRVIVFGATSLDIDLLPALYETLGGIGPAERLNVVVYCRGGSVNAARRVALLLREFAGHLRFIVPHFCESAGTVMALAADEIVAGPLAIFSPTDPHIAAADSAGGGPSALSSQDVRLFAQMGQDWFGMERHSAQERALPQLCESIFPTTLTSLYRCTREVQDISNELLASHFGERDAARCASITDTLLFAYHSHTYALTREDLARMGLPIVRDAAVETTAWEIARDIRACIGAESRQSLEGDWHDAVLITRDGGVRRRRSADAPAARWESLGTNG